MASSLHEGAGNTKVGVGALERIGRFRMLRESDELDLHSYERTIDDIRGQERDTRVVTRSLQVTVEQCVGKIASCPDDEVHRQERDIVEHVDKAQLRMQSNGSSEPFQRTTLPQCKSP